ncbi:Ig-like domain-containing protein [Seonamhaeicola maritimus]|uniref:T9SS type A sorting domain-containing protein n=1 Tax=Seonamhaeicola maritimus TaxID=2591822 RepID=A0A5C7GKJ9_9FLAO|nr:Ig-like domain-containing protein [Seonamhaeicola maritimus]TXG38531.1 T9SS type A sorting domain-containing protein [Seonamhaeicola maritimus]
MTKKTTLILTIGIFLSLFSTRSIAQNTLKYGPDYIVFEAEDTDTPLAGLWTVRTPSDPDYLKYLTNVGSSPDPVNDSYLEYSGPWLGAGSELEYKFTCQKTGTYQLAMRMHSPLRDGELADKRNDFFIKMEGNFTSGSAQYSETDLKTFHKLFGRGANKWGTCINLEHNGNNGVFYNFIEGEEYTFYLKGRSGTAVVDYITFYDTSYLPHNINNQSTDLALQLPEEIRPYGDPTNLSLNPSPGDIRTGTSLQMETIMTPVNGNPSVTWSSSNDLIISVDQDGVITAEGSIGQSATITATSSINNTLMATSEITIVTWYAIPVTSISVSPEDSVFEVGESEQLTASVLPANADNPAVTWSSSDDAIATVDQSGNVTGVSQGTVQIRATSDENNTIFDEVDIEIGTPIPQAVSIDKINGMTVDAFKTSRSNQIEIGEVLAIEVSYSGITEFNTSGFGRVVLRYAINNGGLAVGPNLNIDNVAIGGAEVTETVNYTVANHGTANNPEPAVLQIFAAQNFAGISTLYHGFQVVPAGSLLTSTGEESLRNSVKIYPNPARQGFLKLDNLDDTSKYDIYNIQGKALLKGSVSNGGTINVSDLNSGIYLLRINSVNGSEVKKFIVD